MWHRSVMVGMSHVHPKRSFPVPHLRKETHFTAGDLLSLPKKRKKHRSNSGRLSAQRRTRPFIRLPRPKRKLVRHFIVKRMTNLVASQRLLHRCRGGAKTSRGAESGSGTQDAAEPTAEPNEYATWQNVRQANVRVYCGFVYFRVSLGSTLVDMSEYMHMRLASVAFTYQDWSIPGASGGSCDSIRIDKARHCRV